MPRYARKHTRKAYAKRRKGTSRAKGAFKSYKGRVATAGGGAASIGILGARFPNYNRGAGFKNTEIKELIYVERQNLAAGAVGVVGSTATYNLNSIYSPRSGGGHQPYYHDQLDAIFTQYQVLRTTVEIQFLATSSNFNMAAIQIHPSSDSSTISGEDVMTTGERPGGRLVNLSTSGEGVQKRIEYSFTPAEIDGYTRATNMADVNRYASNFGTSPSAIPKLEIGLGNIDGTGSTTMMYTIMLRFLVKCIGRKELAAS